MGIDFIIIWVDGKDENWRKKKNAYKASEKGDDSDIRYRDWGLLKYWFRGVETFAPWVRKIYFVSDNQCPDWLNKNNGKLHIISHEEFIPKKYLPTFNSHTIELNLHRIKGLSEQFVYFNDDMYLIKAVMEKDFFIKGLPVDNANLNPVILTEPNGIGNIIANNIGIINSNFSKSAVIRSSPWKWFNVKYGARIFRTIFLLPWRHFSGFYNDHLPQPFLKSVYEEVWEKEGQYLDETCKHKFRNYQQDVSQWLIRYWQLASNQFFPGNPYRGKDIDIMTSDFCNIIKKQKFKMICINDNAAITDYEQRKMQLVQTFQEILPQKSNFER